MIKTQRCACKNSHVKNLPPVQPLQPGHYGKFCTTINQCRDDWVQLFMFAFIRTMMTQEPKKRSDRTPLPTKSWMAKRQKLQSGNWIQGWSTCPISLAPIKPSCISVLVRSHQGSVEQPWKLDPWIHLRWQAWCRPIKGRKFLLPWHHGENHGVWFCSYAHSNILEKKHIISLAQTEICVERKHCLNLRPVCSAVESGKYR